MNSRVSILLAFVVLAGVTTVAAFTWLQRKDSVRAPKYIAAFSCLLLGFTLFQGMMWPARPEPGWQPSWWQSGPWAEIGVILALPAMIPMLFAQELGCANIVIGWLAFAVGFLAEFVSLYALVYFPMRFLFRRVYDFGTPKTVG